MRNAVLITLFSAFSVLGYAQTSTEEGLATFYSNKFNGRKTSNGEIYRHTKLTAAHPTLPFGTEVMVTNLRNNKSVIVKVNDRCPSKRIIIDLSKAAASKIEMIAAGVQMVRLEVVTDSIKQAYLAQEIGAESVSSDTSQAPKVIIPQVKGNFAVQVASVASLKNADKLVDYLTHCYSLHSGHRKTSSKGKPLYKVLVGSFPTRNEAVSFLQQVKITYPTAFITSL